MWHVQYRKNAVDHIDRHPTPQTAIEAACNLLDDGYDVYGIGTGPLTDSIDQDQVTRIYAIWVRAKCPFGHVDNAEKSNSRRARSSPKAETPA